MTLTRLVSGQIFMYVYVIIGMCYIQNLNCICIEDCYLTAKYMTSFDWLTGDGKKIDPEQMEGEEKVYFENKTKNWNIVKLILEKQGVKQPDQT